MSAPWATDLPDREERSRACGGGGERDVQSSWERAGMLGAFQGAVLRGRGR